MDTLVGKGAGVEGFEDSALREVLAMERQAQGIIQDAEAEAQRVVTVARQRAQETKQSAESQAAEWEQAAMRQAFEEIAQETQAIESAAEKDAQAWLATAQRCFDAAVSHVLDAVTLGEIDGPGTTRPSAPRADTTRPA